MTLPVPAAVPPIVTKLDSLTKIPELAFPNCCSFPFLPVPIMLPTIRIPGTNFPDELRPPDESSRSMPLERLRAMTFPSPEAVPPMVELVTRSKKMPSEPLPNKAGLVVPVTEVGLVNPVTSVPMKLSSRDRSVGRSNEPEPTAWIPNPRLPEMSAP